MLIAMLFGQAFFNSDTKLVFVCASVIFGGKTAYFLLSNYFWLAFISAFLQL